MLQSESSRRKGDGWIIINDGLLTLLCVILGKENDIILLFKLEDLFMKETTGLKKKNPEHHITVKRLDTQTDGT